MSQGCFDKLLTSMEQWLVLWVASDIRKGVTGKRVGVHINVKKLYGERDLGDYILERILVKYKPTNHKTPAFLP